MEHFKSIWFPRHFLVSLHSQLYSLSENWFYPEAHSAPKFLHWWLLPTSEVSSHMAFQYGMLYSTCYTVGEILVNTEPHCSRHHKRGTRLGQLEGLPKFWQHELVSIFLI
jgi:hypothetical protein